MMSAVYGDRVLSDAVICRVAAARSRKTPIEVTVVGSIAAGDMRGLAGVLLRLNKQSTLKAVSNEQQGSTLHPVK
jgi:hypothetical protein